MKSTRGYYSVIQYCPNPSRAEGANIGVVLFCPDARFLEVRTSRANDRARRFFGSQNVDLRRLEAAKRTFENRLRSAGADFRSAEDLDAFMRTRANALRLIPSRPVKVASPKETLDSLFSELVGGRSRSESVKSQFPEVDALFRRPQVVSRIRFDEVVTVPVVERRLVVPYAYTNGTENLVLPRMFSETPNSATGTAMRLAVEGDLLKRHADKQLVVIAGFRGSSGEQLSRHIKVLFEEYQTRLVLQSGLEAFATEL